MVENLFICVILKFESKMAIIFNCNYQKPRLVYHPHLDRQCGVRSRSWLIYLCCCCSCCVASVMSDSVRPHRWQPPGSAGPGILQAWTLEWVAISLSNSWKWKVKMKSFSRVWLFKTPSTAAHQAPPSMGFSRQEDWSGVPSPSPLILVKELLHEKLWNY